MDVAKGSLDGIREQLTIVENTSIPTLGERRLLQKLSKYQALVPKLHILLVSQLDKDSFGATFIKWSKNSRLYL